MYKILLYQFFLFIFLFERMEINIWKKFREVMKVKIDNELKRRIPSIIYL